MKTGRYSLRQLLTHNEIEQIIIPEIQRDYVWEISNVKKLFDDINAGYHKKESLQLEIKVNDTPVGSESVMQFLTREYERLVFHQKLGFIYAYHDRDYAGKFFLIDGQQRITTLFLMLLSLYKSIDRKTDDFRKLYFNNGLPKVDYKVREQSHDFLLLLISNVLEGKNFKDAEQFYSKEYLKDITIRHLIKNFEFIDKQIASISDKNGFLDYLENFVEVNYFDTHLSEQGEQLYIYMNSRGEQLSHQEMVRAELMQKVTNPDEKIRLGCEWEKWQNFFWWHRGSNENADKGFEEFLKWATIIHLALHENNDVVNFVDSTKGFTNKQLKESYIRDSFNGELKRRQKDEIFKYQIKHLHFNFLRKLFDALRLLYGCKRKYIPIQEKWLGNGIGMLDYVVLLPILYYLSENEWETSEEQTEAVERLAMFFKNITYFEAVSKNPDKATLDALEIVRNLRGDQKDITCILEQPGVTKTILTDAEKYKLELFKNKDNRSEWETLIWDITLDEEFSKFLMGDISVIWKCLETEKSVNPDRDSKFIFAEYHAIIRNLIFANRTTDKLRRLILCKFDYLIESGTGNGLQKYSFIGNGTGDVFREWKETLVKRDFVELLIWIKNNGKSDLNALLEDAQRDLNPTGWRNAFIKVFDLLKYCTQKKILFRDEHQIVLLEKTNYSPTLSREIQYALLQSSFKEMWIYENSCCVLDFDWNATNAKIDLKTSGNQGFAIDLKYSSSSRQWTFSLHHRVKSIGNLLDISGIPEWQEKDDRLTIGNGEFYTYNIHKSLLENNNETVLKLNELISKTQLLLTTNHIR